jgi:hypothetical protein
MLWSSKRSKRSQKAHELRNRWQKRRQGCVSGSDNEESEGGSPICREERKSKDLTNREIRSWLVCEQESTAFEDSNQFSELVRELRHFSGRGDAQPSRPYVQGTLIGRNVHNLTFQERDKRIMPGLKVEPSPFQSCELKEI